MSPDAWMVRIFAEPVILMVKAQILVNVENVEEQVIGIEDSIFIGMNMIISVAIQHSFIALGTIFFPSQNWNLFIEKLHYPVINIPEYLNNYID